jgi:hypothetical protein
VGRCLSGQVLTRENFPYSGQVRPSAAAAGRRAGPVLAPLRAAGPAAAHTERPDDRGWNSSATGPRVLRSSCSGASGPAFSAADPDHGRSPPVKAAIASLRDHAAREPGPVALVRKDWPLRRQALGMILRVLRWGDQRQIRMLCGDVSRARRCEERMG